MTLTLEKPLDRAISSEHPPEFRWTVDAFHKAFDAGVFGDDVRLELIQGRLIERMPPGPAHCYMADIIADMLRSVLDKNQFLREEKPIILHSMGNLFQTFRFSRGKTRTTESVILPLRILYLSWKFRIPLGSLILGESRCCTLMQASKSTGLCWSMRQRSCSIVSRHRMVMNPL